jgi:phosphoribosylamine---glycine ligase
MKILVIGGGGREHAICWKLAASPRRPRLFCAPGNAGTANLAENVNIPTDNINALLAFAKKERIDLTVVGPEDPLCAGIVDQFESAGLRIFGPRAAAARLEGDKAFAKQLMREAGVPTAECRIFGPTNQEIAQAKQAGRDKDEAASPGYQSGYDMARHYVSTRDEGIVIKASGLAKGKGVFVHPDPADGLLTLEDLMVHRKLGDAGRRVVIEELLLGREVSVLALIDGQTIYTLETASDHKRLGENETGPNTGGMGAYSPSDVLTESDMATIEREVFVPIVDALRRDEVVYRGVLYAGIMMTAGGPKVLEFNCRFGDPETQPILMRMENDLLDALEATVNGTLDQVDLHWKPDSAVCVVMASAGYPDQYAKGESISGLEEAAELEGVQVFHAGTTVSKERIVTAGGRVLGVTALGANIAQARQRAYEATQRISYKGAYFRGDIAMRVSGR